MKQLLSLALALIPCLAWAQYPSNGNQKITLGEQTTADGLIWRGSISDTANLLTNKLDTSVYIVLDTGTRAMWYYRASTTPKWTRLVDSLNNLQGQLSLTSKVTGTLPVANGGTGATTFTAGRVLFGNGTSAINTSANLFWDNTNNRLGIGVTPSYELQVLKNQAASTTISIDNNTGNAAAHSQLLLHTGGSTSGDPFINFNNEVTAWSIGTDNSDSDKFKISQNSTLGTNDFLTIQSNGYTGIGTITPDMLLSVIGTDNTAVSSTTFWNFTFKGAELSNLSNTVNTVTGLVFTGGSSRTSISGIANILESTSLGALAFFTGGRGVANTVPERMRISSGGYVGIGTSSPAVQFHTTGGVRFAGLASITDLRTDASGNLFNGSDFNLKNSIDTINFGLSDVLKLKPVSFNWNDEQRNINEYKSMGFIAQDVMNIIPNAVSTMGDGDMQVDYNAIVATLTKAIQEQTIIIKQLEDRIKKLEEK